MLFCNVFTVRVILVIIGITRRSDRERYFGRRQHVHMFPVWKEGSSWEEVGTGLRVDFETRNDIEDVTFTPFLEWTACICQVLGLAQKILEGTSVLSSFVI